MKVIDFTAEAAKREADAPVRNPVLCMKNIVGEWEGGERVPRLMCLATMDEGGEVHIYACGDRSNLEVLGMLDAAKMIIHENMKEFGDPPGAET